MKGTSNFVHVYLMPGMAASPSIFDYIQLPEERFELHRLTWETPIKRETLVEYSERMAAEVIHKNCVLIGVSFGGMVVQEMSKFLSLKKLIIISSVKTKFELPRRMRFARKTGFYHFLPTSLVNYVEHLDHLPLGDFTKKRLQLYKRYMSVPDKRYLDWALKELILWDRETPIEGIVHIHGDKDEVFPIKYIDDCIIVPDGTHIMIINRYKWFNKKLPELLEEEKFADKLDL